MSKDPVPPPYKNTDAATRPEGSCVKRKIQSLDNTWSQVQGVKYVIMVGCSGPGLVENGPFWHYSASVFNYILSTPLHILFIPALFLNSEVRTSALSSVFRICSLLSQWDFQPISAQRTSHLRQRCSSRLDCPESPSGPNRRSRL